MNYKWHKFLFEQHTKSISYSPDIISKIMEYESFSSEPYDDRCGYDKRPRQNCLGTPTIGYGTTVYPDGRKVTLQDPAIDKNKAVEYLKSYLNIFTQEMMKVINVDLNQNQIDALYSFVYNFGITKFAGSELLKKINKNPKDPTIKDEFMKFVIFKGVESEHQKKRRQYEANLYFSPVKVYRWIDRDEPISSSEAIPATQSIPPLGFEKVEVYQSPYKREKK